MGVHAPPPACTVSLPWLLLLSLLLGPLALSPAAGAPLERYVAFVEPPAVLSAHSRSAAVLLLRRQRLAASLPRLGATGVSTVSLLSDAVSFLASPAVAQQARALPGVKSVYKSAIRYKLQAPTCQTCDGLLTVPPLSTDEAVPYGVSLIQADDPDFLAATNGKAAPGVTVCIMDTGVDSTHPDLAGNVWSGYTPSPNDPVLQNGDLLFRWNATYGEFHGTLITGTVAALKNGLGVVGVISGGARLYNVNVFGPLQETSDWQIIQALDSCYSELQQRQAADPLHKMVVSMSLGGPQSFIVEDGVFDFLYRRKDVLFVAAAGNDGNDTINYPAGYKAVVSVAAADCTGATTSFSQYNRDVEITAPGALVLSTMPRNSSGIGQMVVKKATSVLQHLTVFATDGGVANPLRELTADLVDCRAANTTCPANVKGNICIIDRGPAGTPVLCARVRTCMAGGAAAVLVIANGCVANTFTLNCKIFDPTCTCPFTPDFVPSFGITSSDGTALRSLLRPGVKATLTVNEYWAAYSGTSLANPHVSGIAAKLWSAFRGCSNEVIRTALTITALDLGAPGRDDNYGWGIVQAADAAKWLQAQPCAATPPSLPPPLPKPPLLPPPLSKAPPTLPKVSPSSKPPISSPRLPPPRKTPPSPALPPPSSPRPSSRTPPPPPSPKPSPKGFPPPRK